MEMQIDWDDEEYNELAEGWEAMKWLHDGIDNFTDLAANFAALSSYYAKLDEEYEFCHEVDGGVFHYRRKDGRNVYTTNASGQLTHAKYEDTNE
jgi:hypothetical protein